MDRQPSRRFAVSVSPRAFLTCLRKGLGVDRATETAAAVPPIGGTPAHASMWGIPGLVAILLVVAACAGTTPPTASPTFPQGPEGTPTVTPEPEASPTQQPLPTANPVLHVDGMATVVRDVDQIADPEHPNHQKDNRKFDPIEAGTQVYLVNKMTRKKMNYWQVYDGPRQDGLIGWIPQLSNGDLNLEPYQPDCPTEFPLTSESFADLGEGEALSCFGNTELTLSGEVTCRRDAPGDFVIGGASFFDVERLCSLGDALGLHGNEIFELLEAPPADSVTGTYLVRGHFDDAESQGCRVIPFGTDPVFIPADEGDPGSIMRCRQMFIVGTVLGQD